MRQKQVVEAKDRSKLPQAGQSAPRAGGSAFAVFMGSWKSNLRGDLTGGFVAAVVSIPMSIGFGLLAFAPFGERFLSIGILTGLYGAIFLGLVALLLGARTVTIYAPRSLIAFMIGSIAMQGFAKPPAGPFGQLEPYYLAVAAGLEARLGPTLGPISGGSPDGYYFGAMLAFAVHRAAIDMLPTLLLFAFSFAVVASLDTLICSRIVEGMTGQRTAANRVLRLIGGANLITPLLGGICGGVSIGASTAGYKGGGRTSLALLVHSAVIFAVVAALAPLLAKLPLVVVGAVLVVTALQLVDRWSLQLVRKVFSRERADWHSTALDLTVILAVAVTAIAGDVAIAVLIGVGVAVVLFVLRMSRSIVRRERYGDEVHD